MTGRTRWDLIALLIAGDHNTLRVRDNDSGQYRAVPWPDTEPDQPYAVHLYDNQQHTRVLTFDLDVTKGDGNVSRDAQYLHTLLGYCGARYVTVASGPSGGIHIHVPFAQPLPFAAARSVIAALEIRLPTLDPTPMYNPTTGAIRTPGSPHRLGGRATIIGDTEDAASALKSGNDRAVVEAIVDALDLDQRILRRGRAPLHPRLYRMLRDGTGTERYESLSEAVMALATSVISRGHDPTWLRAQLADERNKLAVMLANHTRRDGSHRDGRRLTETAIRKAHAFVQARPSITSPDDVQMICDQIEQHARTSRWVGRQGLSALAALHVCLTTTRRCGSIHFNLSQRSLCEQASFRTRATAERAMRHLAELGYVMLERNGTETQASTWRLKLPTSAPTQLPVRGDRLGHTLFGWRELGKAAGRVVAALQDGPQSRAELTARTGLHRTTVRNALQKLATLNHPVALHDGDRWKLCACRDLQQELDEAARSIGADLAAAALVTRHETERTTWRRWLERREAVRRDRAPTGTRAGPLPYAA